MGFFLALGIDKITRVGAYEEEEVWRKGGVFCLTKNSWRTVRYHGAVASALLPIGRFVFIAQFHEVVDESSCKIFSELFDLLVYIHGSQPAEVQPCFNQSYPLLYLCFFQRPESSQCSNLIQYLCSMQSVIFTRKEQKNCTTHILSLHSASYRGRMAHPRNRKTFSHAQKRCGYLIPMRIFVIIISWKDESKSHTFWLHLAYSFAIPSL